MKIAEPGYCNGQGDDCPSRGDFPVVTKVEGGHVDIRLCPSCLVAAVLADPDALWAVQGEKVLGPWERSDKHSRRCHINGYSPNNGIFTTTLPRDGQWIVTHWKNGPEVVGKYVERAEAEDHIDAELRKAGWLLANKEVKP